MVGLATRMPRKAKSNVEENAGESDRILIKRYGNRRLYNTETSSYLNYQDLVKLIRDGHDVQVIDSVLYKIGRASCRERV